MKSSNFIITLLSVNILILLYFIFFSYNPSANECLNDPLVYGYKQLDSVNVDKLSCQCNLMSQYPSPTLYFDKDGRRFEQPISNVEGSKDISLNLSILK